MLTKLLGDEFVRVMSFMKPRIWRYGIGMLGMTAITVGLSLAEAFALKYIMDATVDRQMSLLITGIMIMLVAILVTLVLTPIFRYMYNSCAALTSAEVRLAVFKHIQKLPISYFERQHSGDTIARLTSDTTAMGDIYTGKLRRFIAPLIFATGSIIAMLVLDWRIGGVLILFNFMSVYINTRFVRPIRRISDKLQQNLGTITENLIDLLAGFSVIKLFHIQHLVLDSYDETNQRVADLSVDRHQVEGLLDSTNFLLSAASNLGTVVVGSYLVAYDITDFGNLLAMINLQSNLNRSLLESAGYLPQVQEALAGAGRVFALLDEPVEPDRYDLPASNQSQADIELQCLNFSYHLPDQVLNELSLVARQGQLVALVGPSGGGKSTIMKLLLGFYPPQRGSIVIKGKPLGSYTLRQLRDMMAYVPQDAYLFEGTIEENIRYGRIDATEEEVQAAAKAAHAHNFIMEQPQAYQTLVGERGTKLSGGQRQRIAIARALLKNASILLLDEATSSLDSKSEQLVQEALETLMAGRTTLAIAHRLSTIEHADMIYVIDRGRVVESGCYQDLLARGRI